ncbi:NUDIX hydrolase [Rubrivirga sp.]|uniref:NUDIX hydrolase n=1 Tax=Rubrivirga sp. TaxID=1885344 RepID=UPI003B51C2D5
MPPIRRWTQLATKTLVDRWWMTLRQDRVRLPNGHVLDEYHVVEYPDWACALALTGDGQAVLVEQYRYGVDRVALELPAGMIDPGEAPEVAARRELLEETGYRAPRWTRLGALAVEPGRHTNSGHLFVARDAHAVADPTPEATEDLRVRLVPAASLPALVEAGRIAHGIHAAAVFWALAKGLLDEPRSATGVQGVHSRPQLPGPMQKEQQTLLVSVNVEEHDGVDAHMTEIGRKVGQGWTVIQAIPLSGEEAGPGGQSEDFMRYQVTVEREIDADNVVVGADRGGAADLKDVGQVSGAFDEGIPGDDA